jgi:hypothetical protein
MTVADGDTFNAKIREGGRWSTRKDIRLLGVQAMELTDYSRAHGRKGECHAVEATERLEYLLQGPKVKRRIVRIASFRKSSKTAGARGRLRRGVAYKSGVRWHDSTRGWPRKRRVTASGSGTPTPAARGRTRRACSSSS